MRSLAAVLLLLLGGCAPAHVARPETSARRTKFRNFRVRAVAVPAEVRHDLTLEEIERLPGAAGRGLKTQGLTTIKHSLATHTRFSTISESNTVYAWFDDVILDVAVSSIVINAPREYPPGSCEYQRVVEHERGHCQVAKEHVAVLAGRLQRALVEAGDLPSRLNPIVSTDVATAAALLKSAVAQVVEPIYQNFEKEENEAQARLDSPDPYETVYRKCRGWK